MKKIIITLILIGFWSQAIYSQEFRTTYVMSNKSKHCGKENFYFNFVDVAFLRVDSYDESQVSGPSKKEQSNYDKNGNYYEIRMPHFFLEENGVTFYNKYSHYSHKIVFDKRGGNVLYVYERNVDLKSKDGKFYFTEKGYEIYCK